MITNTCQNNFGRKEGGVEYVELDVVFVIWIAEVYVVLRRKFIKARCASSGLFKWQGEKKDMQYIVIDFGY
jgi:hypothetical protein